MSNMGNDRKERHLARAVTERTEWEVRESVESIRITSDCALSGHESDFIAVQEHGEAFQQVARRDGWSRRLETADSKATADR